jgi:hypothetical protein
MSRGGTFPERPVDAASLLGVDLVQALSHLGVLMLGQELGDGGGIQLTPRNTKALGERISIPGYNHRRMLRRPE